MKKATIIIFAAGLLLCGIIFFAVAPRNSQSGPRNEDSEFPVGVFAAIAGGTVASISGASAARKKNPQKKRGKPAVIFAVCLILLVGVLAVIFFLRSTTG